MVETPRRAVTSVITSHQDPRICGDPNPRYENWESRTLTRVEEQIAVISGACRSIGKRVFRTLPVERGPSAFHVSPCSPGSEFSGQFPARRTSIRFPAGRKRCSHAGRTTSSHSGHSAKTPVVPSSFVYSINAYATQISLSQSGQTPSIDRFSFIIEGGAWNV